MHFLVIVAGNDWEAELIPFFENLKPPSKYLRFIDTSDTGRLDYDTGSTEMLVLADGTRLHMFHGQVFQYLRKLTDAERKMDWQELKTKFKVVFGMNEHMQAVELPPGSEVCDVPFLDLYLNFTDFMREWHGDEPSPETGRYGHWENPKGKWDGYSMGGRCTGLFIAKPGRSGLVGEPGLLRTTPEPGRFDQMRKADVDFAAMEARSYAEAEAVWDELSAQISPGFFDGLKDFETILARYPEDRLSAAKAFDGYWRQPAAVHFKGGLLLAGKQFAFQAETARDVLAKGRSAYAETWATAAWLPTAVLLGGHWNESADDGYQAWVPRARSLIFSLPDDTIITAVDCHS